MLSEKEKEPRCEARPGCGLLLTGGGPDDLPTGVLICEAPPPAPSEPMLVAEFCLTRWEPELDRSSFTESPESEPPVPADPPPP